MAALNIVASKAKPAGFDSWTTIPGTDRAVLKIQNDDFDVDTALVIDANDSMLPFWDDMGADSTQFAHALIAADSDGIDAFFAGVNSGEDGDHDSPAGGFLNVSNPLFLLEAFQKIKEAGLTKEEAVPAVVASIFNKYLANYKAAADKSEIKRLNIIVWTDGSYPQEAFEASLVATANALKEIGAPETQIGIQLFRVGNVAGVKEKFDYYDNELKAAHGLDRDIVDHQEYTPNGLTEELITKVGSGAVEKAVDNA